MKSTNYRLKYVYNGCEYLQKKKKKKTLKLLLLPPIFYPLKERDIYYIMCLVCSPWDTSF